MMRYYALLVSGASAALFRHQAAEIPTDFQKAPDLEDPAGIAKEESDPADASALVECTGEVAHYTKSLFSTMMGCGKPSPPASKEDAASMCNTYGKGGCDNEICHEFCHSLYTSEESYKTCKCKSWGDAAAYKEHAPGAPCPLKVQPRCFNGDMYRSECEALFANEGVSAADLKVVPVSEWPKDDKSAVKKGACPP